MLKPLAMPIVSLRGRPRAKLLQRKKGHKPNIPLIGWWEQTSAITKRVNNPTYTLMVSRLTDHKEANNPSHSERPCPFQQLGDQESLKTAGHLLSKKGHLGIPESTCGVGVGCPVEQKDVPSNSRGPTGFGCPTLSQQGLTLSRRDQNNGTWLRASSVPSNSLGVGVAFPTRIPQQGLTREVGIQVQPREAKDFLQMSIYRGLRAMSP